MKYLKPFNFYRGVLKRDLEGIFFPGSLVCLNATDKYVSMALVDQFQRGACVGGTFARDGTILDRLLKEIQIENSESVHAHYMLKLNSSTNSNMSDRHLKGIIFGKQPGAPANILFDDLCKTPKLESLKYTYWEDDITSVTFDPHSQVEIYVNIFCSPPVISQDIIDRFSALYMMQAYLDFFNTFVQRAKYPDIEDSK